MKKEYMHWNRIGGSELSQKIAVWLKKDAILSENLYDKRKAIIK
ncbi:MAG: hypothetical protein Q4D16_00145 [Eubacteriales bacterium]|nr:hypothetical protein [Eubacteriales bacterium]